MFVAILISEGTEINIQKVSLTPSDIMHPQKGVWLRMGSTTILPSTGEKKKSTISEWLSEY